MEMENQSVPLVIPVSKPKMENLKKDIVNFMKRTFLIEELMKKSPLLMIQDLILKI